MAAGLGGVILTALIMFQTSSGTLVVEASDDAKILFQNGQLHILDESGKVAYRLTAQAPSQDVKPGKYQVRVVGVDGLSVDTESFVISRNKETHIRVKAVSDIEALAGGPVSIAENSGEKAAKEPLKIASETNAVTGSGSGAIELIHSFQGRALLQADFSDAKQWPLPLVNKPTVESRIEKRHVGYEQDKV